MYKPKAVKKDKDTLGGFHQGAAEFEDQDKFHKEMNGVDSSKVKQLSSDPNDGVSLGHQKGADH